jgi:hypothetical protein
MLGVCPDYADLVANIESRMIDLLEPFRCSSTITIIKRAVAPSKRSRLCSSARATKAGDPGRESREQRICP